MWKAAVYQRWRRTTRASGVSAAGSGDVELQHEGGQQKGEEHHRRKRNSSSVPVRQASSRFGSRKRDKVGGVLAGLFMCVILLLLVDVMKSRRVKNELQWERYYMRAVVGDDNHWQLGWRLEDLARQATNQKTRMATLLETLEQMSVRPGDPSLPLAAKVAAWVGRPGKEDDGDLRAVLLARLLVEEEDFNRVVSVECATRPRKYVQVGLHAMVASAQEECKVFSAAVTPDPHALFEKIDLGQGRFALRAFSNHRFLRVVPPEESTDWSVWSLEVGSPEVGLPEVFQMRDGMVYNEVMHGYLSCSGQGSESEVKGFVGEYLWQDLANYQIIFNQVSDEIIERARTLRYISEAVHAAQQLEANQYIARQAALSKNDGEVAQGAANSKRGGGQELPVIAICVPTTSRSTVMKSTFDSPVWTNAFQTFLSTIDWWHHKFRFHWYLGFDVGDPIYDGPDAVENLQHKFIESAMKEFNEQDLPYRKAVALMENVLVLNTKHFQGMEHAPSYVVSALIQDAYDDGCDYFYQINDDTLMNSPGWAETFTTILQNNPLGRNVGVTGPTDTNNRRILTHAFVHRTHMEVFGRYFPLSFRNWWSDDWISNVYGRAHTLRDHLVTITHDVHSHKSDTTNRYTIDFTAQQSLRGELQKGHVQLSRWLKAKGLPPPSMPMVCGYAPLASNIFGILQERYNLERGSAKKNSNGAAAAAAAAAAAGDTVGDPNSPDGSRESKVRRRPNPPGLLAPPVPLH